MTDQKTNETEAEKRSFPWRTIGVLISTFAILIFVCAFAYGYFELSKVNIALAQKVSDLQDRTVSAQNDIALMQKSMDALQQTGKETEELKKQQEQMLSEWRAAQKGDFNKWQVAEAQYLVKLANDHLQFTYNYKAAAILLQRADQLLANLQDATLLEIRKSLAADIAKLQALPDIDIAALFLRITALNVQLDHLPLPINPLKDDSKKEVLVTSSAESSWWKAAWDHTLQALNKIVIVRKNGANSLPLVLPEEKTFLYQNLHAQLENAKWAVLYRNQSIYQISLARAVVWINQYFAHEAPETKAMLQNLNELLKINIQPAESNLAVTLQLFEKYFAEVQTATA